YWQCGGCFGATKNTCARSQWWDANQSPLPNKASVRIMNSLSIRDLNQEIEIQSGSIVSKTLRQDATSKIVLFGFDSGQELSEHTAAVPAVMHFVDGESNVTIGDGQERAGPGSFYFMEAAVPHSITATRPTKMLLTLFKSHPKKQAEK
ncbi:MAG: cupin domain-containing protein, partial [Planctomycetota bacterium]